MRISDWSSDVCSSDLEEISRACGGKLKGEERFALGKWLEGVDGVPVLADSQASIVCKNEVSVSYGTHGIFIGKVLQIFQHGEVDPLVYIDGRYTTTLPARSDEHTSELQSLMPITYAVYCLKQKKPHNRITSNHSLHLQTQ